MKSDRKDFSRLFSRSLSTGLFACAVLAIASNPLTMGVARGGHHHRGVGGHYWGGAGAGLHCYRAPYTQWSCRPPVQWRAPCFSPCFSQCFSPCFVRPTFGCFTVRPWCGGAYYRGCGSYYWSTSTFLNVGPIGFAPGFAAAPRQADPQLVARLNQPIRVATNVRVAPVARIAPVARTAAAGAVASAPKANSPFAARDATSPPTAARLAAASSAAASSAAARPSSETARRRADKFVQQGDELFRRGRHFEALSLYQHARTAAPDSADAFVREGFAYVAVRRYERAAEAFRRGMAIDASYVADKFRIDELYGDDATAQKTAHLEQLAKAAFERPDQADLVYLTGVFLLCDGQPDRAETFLAQTSVTDLKVAARP